MTQVLAHKLVAKVAKECCSADYDRLARDNRFFKHWPSERCFVGHNWRFYIKTARACLTKLLANPNFPEDKKEEIFEALMLDRSIPRGGSSVPAIPGLIMH